MQDSELRFSSKVSVHDFRLTVAEGGFFGPRSKETLTPRPKPAAFRASSQTRGGNRSSVRDPGSVGSCSSGRVGGRTETPLTRTPDTGAAPPTTGCLCLRSRTPDVLRSTALAVWAGTASAAASASDASDVAEMDKDVAGMSW
jgi:hypothetical protein